MKIKDKIYNKLADFMYKYKSDDMDKIKNCLINAKVGGAVITTSGEFVNEIKSKEKDGEIDVNVLLEEEITKNEMRNIVFCDEGRIVCLTNQAGSSYVETSHEYFELANESVYIMCNSKASYNSFKEYILQSSKWKGYMTYSQSVPNEQAFFKLFNLKNKSQSIEKEEQESNIEKEEDISKTESRKNSNIIELDGIITNKGKPFLKRDNKQAQYLELSQKNVYNGKTQSFNVTISLEDDILDAYGKSIDVGDKVKVVGKLINYVDKNNKPQTIINSFDFEILEKANQKNRDMEVDK